MSTLNLSDTEQRVESFQSRLRADYAAKLQEVAKLTDFVTKLQTQLLDVEYENNLLRQQLVIANTEIDQLKKAAAATSEKGILSAAGLSTEAPEPLLKRERSHSLEITDIPPPSKKAKGEEREDPLASDMDVDPQVISSAKPPSSPEELVLVGHSLSLPQSVANKYLQAIPAFDVHPPPPDTEFHQNFLRARYGFSNKKLPMAHSDKNNPSGPDKRHVVFLHSHLQPFAPIRPGKQGLVLAFLHEILTDSSLDWSVFCNERGPKGVLWRYKGEYRFEAAGQMEAEHFRMQSNAAKHKTSRWVLNNADCRQCNLVRARISLRLAAKIPLEDKDKEEKRIQAEAAIKNEKHWCRRVSEDHVTSALTNGEEHVDIFSLRCVGYDHVFANDMQASYNANDYNIFSEKPDENGGKKEDKAHNENSRAQLDKETEEKENKQAVNKVENKDEEGQIKEEDLTYPAFTNYS